ncbi:MAG TPA: signal peptidase II [Phycisphaerales bacterium]|nr:signal peptidase II [Phycisphaerales bacterium]
MTHRPPTKNRETMPPQRRPNAGDSILFLSISLIGAALDLWSKYAVFHWLEGTLSQQYTLINGFLRFIIAENPGAAFSLFSGMRWMFVGVSMIALIVINTLFVLGKLTPRLTLAAMGCIHAGVIGNLYDRLFNEGRVRDFIDVYVGSYHWPTFNVADSLLCIGVGILLITGLTSSDKH